MIACFLITVSLTLTSEMFLPDWQILRWRTAKALDFGLKQLPTEKKKSQTKILVRPDLCLGFCCVAAVEEVWQGELQFTRFQMMLCLFSYTCCQPQNAIFLSSFSNPP